MSASSRPEPGRGSDPGPSAREVERIRAVYQERDARGRRHPAIAEAYRRLNAQRVAAMHELLRTVAPPPGARLLDVGCGGGHDISRWVAAGWPPEHLAGVDLVPERARAARAANPGVDIRIGDGALLPFDRASFDAATAVTVFSSILDERLRAALFEEMVRVVRPGGLVVVYDFVIRKPTNPDVVRIDMRTLRALAGRAPDGSRRLSPLLQAVAAGAAVHPRLADVAMALAPPTHRLSYWRVPVAASAR